MQYVTQESKKADVEYVIDCAEEACGDMNQRGGGNFAKAAAEVAGLVSASGSDARGFCAAPTHALIEAAALVKSGAYKCVAVTAGGCTAKLGMNGKDHIKKGLPILEDCLGGFCVILAENDGVNPEIDLSMLGRHSVGTGSAPQNVIGSLVADPLDRAGMKITDIDKYSPEMQNPDITKPAGAGDVPLANYKMIAALAVKRGELDRKEIGEFPAKTWTYRMGTDTGTYPIRSTICRSCKRGHSGRKDQECNDHRKRKSVPWKNDKPVRWSIFRDPWKYKGTGRSCSRSI